MVRQNDPFTDLFSFVFGFGFTITKTSMENTAGDTITRSLMKKLRGNDLKILIGAVTEKVQNSFLIFTLNRLPKVKTRVL